MTDSMLEKASAYDKNGLMKHEIDNALSLLKQFRAKYPFAENPESIDSLAPDDILKIESGELGEFFHYIVLSQAAGAPYNSWHNCLPQY